MLWVQVVGWWPYADADCETAAPDDVDETAADEGDVGEVVVDVVHVAGGGAVVAKDVFVQVVLVAFWVLIYVC